MKTFALTLAASAVVLAAPFAVNAKPAAVKNVVLVHGAFANEHSWDKVANLLRQRGYTVAQVANPLTSLADDVAATEAAIAVQKGDVVLVGHSWGGVVIGEAGTNPKVKSLVYVAAFAPDAGESLAALQGNSEPTEGLKTVHPDARGYLTVDPVQFPAVFAGDVPVVEAQKLAATQLPVNSAVFGEKSIKAAWRTKANFYAISSEDKMIAPQAQAFFAQRIKATTVTLKASHASPVSQPEAIADLIEQAAKAK